MRRLPAATGSEMPALYEQATASLARLERFASRINRTIPAAQPAHRPGRDGSIDGGRTWMSEETGFGPAVTMWLSIVKTTEGQKHLFALTHGRGAWKVRLP